MTVGSVIGQPAEIAPYIPVKVPVHGLAEETSHGNPSFAERHPGCAAVRIGCHKLWRCECAHAPGHRWHSADGLAELAHGLAERVSGDHRAADSNRLCPAKRIGAYIRFAGAD
jgi:hypothetical protein